MEQSSPLSVPFLAGEVPTRRLDSEELSERILNLLASQNMCVLATCGSDGPLATPVRYYSRGFDIIFTASPNSPKMRNLAADPRVSVGVFAPHVGLASSRGCQIFGSVAVALPGSPEFDEAMESYRWQSDAADRGRSGPPSTAVATISAERVVYTEHWLRRGGFAPRQFWRRDEGATG